MNCRLDVELSPELEIYRDKIEATIKPYIEIKLTDNDKPTWWQSKFGGLPYLPKGFDYPKSFDGEYLYLLAQINFTEVPHLEGFPDKGILQFYIAADDEFYGSDFEYPTLQDKFRVIYFPEIEFQQDNLITDFSFLAVIEDKYIMPFEECCCLGFTSSSCVVSMSDYKFDFFDIYKDEYQDISEEYWDKFNPDGHKLSGHPSFTQNDPRLNSNFKEQDYVLLLQIDSDSNDKIDIMWGDLGIGNFFIKKSDLEKRDFSNILYNWDCG